VDVAGLAGVDTLVVLMGRAGLESLAARQVAAGRERASPAAGLQRATTPEQRVTRATLGTIAAAADRDGLENPIVTVIGAVAALGDAELEKGLATAALAAAIGA
jgi:siroheme synthase